MPGVHRRMIERDGQEQARCLSRVTYAPGSSFTAHSHPWGEEILVLSGTFHDQHGSYPAGTFMRSPHGSTHAPGSVTGCELLVKLRHLTDTDQRRRVIDTLDPSAGWQPLASSGGTLRGLWLGGYQLESTWLIEAAAGTEFTLPHPPGHPPAGEELYDLSSGCWERRPAGVLTQWQALTATRYWAKVGHLRLA